MEEILCAIGAAIFSILAVVFGVKNRVHSSRPNTNRGICSEGSRYNDLVSNSERLERDKDRIQELNRRDDDNIAECAKISERIRKREPETSVKK